MQDNHDPVDVERTDCLETMGFCCLEYKNSGPAYDRSVLFFISRQLPQFIFENLKILPPITLLPNFLHKTQISLNSSPSVGKICVASTLLRPQKVTGLMCLSKHYRHFVYRSRFSSQSFSSGQGFECCMTSVAEAWVVGEI